MLIEFLISFKVAFGISFLTCAGNLVTGEKCLGSGLECDTAEPDSLKLGDSLFSLFTMASNTLFKPLIIILADSYAPFNLF